MCVLCILHGILTIKYVRKRKVVFFKKIGYENTFTVFAEKNLSGCAVQACVAQGSTVYTFLQIPRRLA